MKAIDVRVNWNEFYDNSPTLEVFVDEYPKGIWDEDPNTNPLRYKYMVTRSGNLFFGELDGYVSFFSGGYPEKSDGYYGRQFPIILESGEKIVLRGPWSSRAGVMNMYFTPCMDISLTEDPKVWEKGHTFYASACTVELIMDWLREHPEVDWTLEREEARWAGKDGTDEHTWEPVYRNGQCPKCKGTGQRPGFTRGETRPCFYREECKEMNKSVTG